MPSIFDRFFLIDGRKKDDSPQSKAYRPMENKTKITESETKKIKVKHKEIKPTHVRHSGSG